MIHILVTTNVYQLSALALVCFFVFRRLGVSKYIQAEQRIRMGAVTVLPLGRESMRRMNGKVTPKERGFTANKETLGD